MDRHSEIGGPISSLIPAVARAHRRRASVLLDGLDLSVGQELLLMMLWEHEPRSQAVITSRLAVEPPTVAKMLARMERSGTVNRERSAADRRVVLVSLTEKGRALQRPVEAAWAALEAETTSGLSSAEAEQLVDLLRKVLGTLTGEQALLDSSPS